MKKSILNLIFMAVPILASAQSHQVVPVYHATATETMKKLKLSISTDKCSYAPGQTIKFSVMGSLPDGLRVRYRHLGDVTSDEAVSSRNWEWTAPEEDFIGYMAELYTTDGTTDYIYGTIAVDVSSDWARFPRYGFVADFPTDKTLSTIKNEMKSLNRYHINGVQFQDWHYAHDCPIPSGGFSATYKDVANRDISPTVVKNYISSQHDYGMKSIFYNLCMGALDGYEGRNVSNRWFMYKDQNHSVVDKHDLPDSWKSDIYLVNPGNADWQRHIQSMNEDVYQMAAFDGYQIDQLGYRGNLYDYNGNSIDLPAGYASFINAMKAKHPTKSLIMNAVSEYGAPEIGGTHNIDFFYNEVWGNHDYDSYTTPEARFTNLKDIIEHNHSYDASKQTVFAAYMDYLRDNEYFNTAGVVMADAVMFALGGSHLELGADHMLCREYFPYAGVKWHNEIEDWMTHYYDFMVAYENLLRGDWADISYASARSQAVTINRWQPVAGQVCVLPRKVGDKMVVHLLNFTKATDAASDEYMLCWHDNKGIRPWPKEYAGIDLTISGVRDEVKRVWVASPDFNGGAVQEISEFTKSSSNVKLTLPNLQFWTMIVLDSLESSGIEDVEFEPFTTTSQTYNILGQPVGDVARGILIKNGRKVIR